jgi:outer membrane protein OmpA-like peptidoglycan-associated protein
VCARLKLNVPSDFTVVGHPDNTGGEAMNQTLSVDRAASVRSCLGQRGVSSCRLAVEGCGEREPLASNASESGRASNRRVEFFLIERSAWASERRSNLNKFCTSQAPRPALSGFGQP